MTVRRGTNNSFVFLVTITVKLEEASAFCGGLFSLQP